MKVPGNQDPDTNRELNFFGILLSEGEGDTKQRNMT